MKAKTHLFIEIGGKQIDTATFIDNIKAYWTAEGNKLKDLETVQLYYKPEENNVYYVINGDIKGEFQV